MLLFTSAFQRVGAKKEEQRSKTSLFYSAAKPPYFTLLLTPSPPLLSPIPRHLIAVAGLLDRVRVAAALPELCAGSTSARGAGTMDGRAICSCMFTGLLRLSTVL